MTAPARLHLHHQCHCHCFPSLGPCGSDPTVHRAHPHTAAMGTRTTVGAQLPAAARAIPAHGTALSPNTCHPILPTSQTRNHLSAAITVAVTSHDAGARRAFSRRSPVANVRSCATETRCFANPKPASTFTSMNCVAIPSPPSSKRVQGRGGGVSSPDGVAQGHKQRRHGSVNIGCAAVRASARRSRSNNRSDG